jgi:hypothetical protein
MIISDIEHVEEFSLLPDLDISGGNGSAAGLSSLFNLISTIYPAASTSILNLGNSGNNTAISINFAMPIMMVFNGYGGGGGGGASNSGCYCRPSRRNYFMGA